MTLTEARRRSGLDLLSDKDMPIVDPIRGYSNPRDGQRYMEKRYPRHRIIRQTALRYFLRNYSDVYRRGVGVNGSSTCLDFAFFKRNQLTFVECLTEHNVALETIKKKRRVQKFALLYFVVEDKPKSEFETRGRYSGYLRRIERLAKRSTVFWCDPITKTIRRFRLG